jgi:hypothetical protein
MANTTFNGPVRSENGFQDITVDATTGAVTVDATFGATTSVTNLTTTNLVFTDQNHPSTAAINATATATAAEVATGYITSTSASPTTITLPTNGILSSAAADTPGSFGDLTIASGVTGLARFTIMFSSATAYVFTRTA